MERASIGRYRVEREVARGGMGVVYRASSPEGRLVAVKLLLAGRDANGPQRRRMATEVQTLLRLRHPNLVELLDAGEEQGVPFLVTAWVEGETLDERLTRGGPLDPRVAVGLIQRLAQALDHCHAQGVLHRDLKPGNVLLRASDGQPLLTDFGLSKDLEAALDGSLAASVAGRWLGTPGYWPPEQARGQREAIGPRSDVYGLGALLYAALTGYPPQSGESIQELLRSLDRPPVPPSRRRPGLPAWLDEVCARALASDPAQRHADPAELERELRRGLTTWGGRHRSGVLRKGAVLVPLVGAVLGLLVWRGSRATDAVGPPTSSPAPASSLSAAPVAPGGSASVSVDQVSLDRAWTLLRVGDLEGALRVLDQVVLREPGNVLAWNERGATRSRLGRHEEALEDFAQALALDPDLIAAWYNRGLSRTKLERWEEAVEDYSQALARDPRMVPTLINRGLALSKLGRLEDALRDYARALELEPDLFEAHHSRGMALAKAERWGEAIPSLERALELKPLAGWQTYHALGAAHAGAGNTQPALDAFARALELEPRAGRVHYSRAVLHERQGQRAAALEDLDRAVALLSHPDCLHLRAKLLEAEGRLEEALADYGRAIELAPANETVVRERGELNHRLSRWEAAAADLERAAQLGGQGAETWFNLGTAQTQCGRWEQALTSFDQALRLNPELALGWINRGAARAKLGRWEEAIADYDRAIALDPRLGQAWLNRGVARANLGRHAAAVPDFDQAIALEPERGGAWLLRGQARLRLAQWAAAATDLERALELPLGSDAQAEARAGLARAREALGR